MKIKNFVPRPSSLITYKQGFTLIELAIVLVIVGLLVGLGTSLIGPLTKRMKYTETKETITAGVESIVGYATSNERIPIWGDYTADNVIDEFIEVVKNPNDAWTKPLYYFFESLLTSNDSVCNRRTTNLTICRDATCTSRTPNIAFVVVSSSENYNPQTGTVTTGCPGGQTCVGVYDVDTPNIDNCTDATNCPNYPAGVDRISRAEPYDDIVKWITLDELRIKTGCVGPQLKILNNELPAGFQNTAYNATVSADGGVPFSFGGNYKWCIKGTLPTGMTNPTPGCPATTSCSTLGGEGATEWLQTNSLSITGTPTNSGSFNITVFVRDNNDNDVTQANDNCAQRSFVMTINPPSWVIVRNATGLSRYYRINGLLPCQTVANNATFSAGFTETITFFTTSARCNSNQISCSRNYASFKASDTDADGSVRLSTITNTSCTISDD